MDIKELLETVAKIGRTCDRSTRNGDFNVFRLCQVNHYETMHSRIIAEFLNPRGTHGFGAAFLKEFFQCVEGVDGFTAKELVVSDIDNAMVVTEERVDDGRCDITIRFGGVCVVVENKI